MGLGNRGRQPGAVHGIPQLQNLSVFRVLVLVVVLLHVVVVVVLPPDPTGFVAEDLERHILAPTVFGQLEVDPRPVLGILFHGIRGPVGSRHHRGGRRPSGVRIGWR